jgi:hypothetical protein
MPAQSSLGDERSPDMYRRSRRTCFLCRHITGPLKRRYTPHQPHTVPVRTAPRSVLRVCSWRDAQGIDKRPAAATATDAADLYRGTATLVCPPGGSCDVRGWAEIGLGCMLCVSLHINTENILWGGGGGKMFTGLRVFPGSARGHVPTGQCRLELNVWQWQYLSVCLSVCLSVYTTLFGRLPGLASLSF